MITEGLLDKALRLRTLLVALSRNEMDEFDEYPSLRDEFVHLAAVRDVIPSFLRTHRNRAEFWPFIKTISPHWEPRRAYIYDHLKPLLDHLEFGAGPTAADAAVGAVITRFDAQGVSEGWSKALERRTNDPAGAITSARTLLEETCKHILDDLGQPYESDADLPKLYAVVAQQLQLAPKQHEETFRVILGSVSQVVERLGSLRNALSDAHGQGRKGYRPLPRHAELAVNLAGAMAAFLIATHEAKLAKQP